MGNVKISLNKPAIADLCRRHHIKRLSLFGSVLGPDFGDQSDVDVLVEFEPGRTPGYAFFAIEDQLSELFGRKVELHTPQFLSSYFRDEVLAAAEVQYAEE